MALRNRRTGDSSRGGGGPRRIPPESTGREAAYLLRKKEGRCPMVVRLVSGSQVRGVIEYFDRDMVKITCPEQPHLFVRKADIRYMYDESEV
jgi:hypothetical protein